MQIPFLGQTLSLLTAVAWAAAVILFKKSGEKVHPIALNFYKNLMGVVLLVPTIMFFGGGFSQSIPGKDMLLFLISGALGIGLADTFFFRSLNMLGAGLSAIVDCLYSPSIIILSFLWLGESLSVLQIIGVFMIISAVLTATGSDNHKIISKRNLLEGIFWGALAMATMAVGIVMVKPLLETSPFLWLTELRLIGGMIVLAIIILFHPRRKQIMLPKLDRQAMTYLLSGSFVGAYVSMILWLAGMKFTNASISAALNQTSNIFIFIFAAVFLKEPITRARTLGILLGVTGVFVVTFG